MPLLVLQEQLHLKSLQSESNEQSQEDHLDASFNKNKTQYLASHQYDYPATTMYEVEHA